MPKQPILSQPCLPFHHARKNVFNPIREDAIACRMLGRVSSDAYLRLPVFYL